MKRNLLWRLCAMILLALTVGGTAWQTAAAGVAAPAPAATSTLFLPLVQSAGGAPAPLTSSYNVAYTDGTSVVDEATVQNNLLAISDDGAILRFKAAAAPVRELRPGHVALFAGKALRRVVSLAEEGDALVVTTEEATLGEAVKNGSIAYAYRSNWADLPPATFLATADSSANPAFRLITSAAPATAGDIVPADFAFSGVIQGWDVILKYTPAPDRLNIDVVASRTFNGAKIAAVSGKGFISNFTQETLLTYEQSTPTRVSVKTTGLKGEMELKWSAFFKEGGEPLTQISAFQIPVELPIPLAVGPIPMLLKVKAVLQSVPELRFQQSSSGGSFKVAFSSDQGFSVDNTLENPFGQLNSSDIGVSGETVSATLVGAAGFGFGVEFPRLELSILNTATAFITVKTYSYSIFTLEPPCQKGGTDLFAVAGYNLKVLGSTIASANKTLWTKSLLKFKDDKPC